MLLHGKSHGRRSLVGCSPWVAKSRTRLSDFTFTSLSCIGKGNGNPLQYSCLENPRDGGAYWAPSMGLHRVRHNRSNLAAAAGFYMHKMSSKKIMSSASNDNFPSSFPMPFFPSSCLAALARISSTVLNKSGESGHPCLVLILEEKLLAFHCCTMILALSLLNVAFIMLKSVPSRHTVLSFLMKGCWILSNAFSASTEIIWFLSFILLMWYVTLIYLQALHHLLMYCWIWFANILLRSFASMFIRDISLYYLPLSSFGIRIMLSLWLWVFSSLLLFWKFEKDCY